MKYFVKLLMVACLVGVAWGQDPGNPLNPADSQVIQNFGVDSINLQNLSVGINIPIVGKTGAIPFSYALRGNSSCDVISTGVNNSVHNVQCGIGLTKATATSAVGGILTYQNWNVWGVSTVNNEGGAGWGIGWGSYTNTSCGGGNKRTYKNLFVADPGGSVYYLPSADTYAIGPTGCSASLDDYTIVAGLHVQMTEPGGILTIVTPSGAVIGGRGVVTDTFGNSVSYAAGQYTDTLATTPVTVAPFNFGTGTAGSYSYSDTTSTARTVSEVINPATIKTAFGCPNTTDLTQSGEVLSEVDYPDGNNLHFAYEQITGGTTGRIDQITLRTGGAINFSYGPILCEGTAFNPTTGLIPTYLSRTTSDGTTKYSFAIFGTAPNNGTTTTVLDPGLNKTIYTFMGTNSYGNAQVSVPLTLTQVQVYQNTGTVVSPVYSLLSTTLYCYN